MLRRPISDFNFLTEFSSFFCLLQVRAAYHAVAVCIEGCSEYIKTHHFDQFVKAILDGIQSANTLVRNAALYALGQASEFLQPGISSKPLVDQFLPVLVRHLDTAIAQLQSQQVNYMSHLCAHHFLVRERKFLPFLELTHTL